MRGKGCLIQHICAHAVLYLVEINGSCGKAITHCRWIYTSTIKKNIIIYLQHSKEERLWNPVYVGMSLSASKANSWTHILCKREDIAFLWNTVVADTSSDLLHFFTCSQPNKARLYKYLDELWCTRREGTECLMSLPIWILVEQRRTNEQRYSKADLKSLVVLGSCLVFD